MRAVRVAAALLIGLVVGYLLSDQLLDLLRTPVEQLAESRNASLNYDTVTGAFDLKLRVALLTGIVLSSPVVLYEVCAFVAPGLTRRERRHVFGYLLAAVPLFAAGCVFGFAMFPHMVELLAGFASEQDSTILSASQYVDFVLKLVVAIGIAFVLPVFVVMLNFVGILSSAAIRRSWRVILVAIVLFAALVTPAADVLSMFLVAAPMAALFVAAIAVIHLHDRRLRTRAAGTSQEVGSPCSA